MREKLKILVLRLLLVILISFCVSVVSAVPSASPPTATNPQLDFVSTVYSNNHLYGAGYTSDFVVYFLDFNKNTIPWNYNIGHWIGSIAISPDGRYIGVGGDEGKIYLFYQNGDLLWKKSFGNAVIKSISFSKEGYFIDASTALNQAYYINRYGDLVDRSPTPIVTVSSLTKTSTQPDNSPVKFDSTGFLGINYFLWIIIVLIVLAVFWAIHSSHKKTGTTRTSQPPPQNGMIYADSIPAGAIIYFEGNMVGFSPLTISNVIPGTYTIESTLNGYHSDTQRITISAGQTYKYSPTLQKLPSPSSQPQPQPETSVRKKEKKTPKIKKTEKVFLLPQILELNAYHILGLDTNSDQKLIQKRGKDLINHIKIDDILEYPLDIDPACNFRTEDKVKIAIQNLLSPKLSLKEFFFWFDFGNDLAKQKQLIDAIRTKSNIQISSLWSDSLHESHKINWIDQKNLALYKTILIFNGNHKYYLTDSLTLWKKVLISNEFWDVFFKEYQVRLGFEQKSEFTKEFLKQAESYLSDIYTEIAEKNNDPDYFLEFQKIFCSKGERIEKDVFTPIFDNLYKIINDLDAITIEKNNRSDSHIIPRIDLAFSKFQTEINKLISFGLYEDSRVKSVRDTFVESVRRVSIQINNEWDDTEKALELVKKAKEFAGTASLENKLNDDITQLTKLISQKKNIGEPIKNAPTLYTINGIGATIYGDTQYFVVIFIPILPIARYSFERVGDKFRFFGKLKLQPWQKTWQYLFIAFLGYLFISYWIFVLLAGWFIILKMQNKDII